MKTMNQPQVIEEALKGAITYTEYRELVNELFAHGKSTGPVQTEPNLIYTELNIHRMSKWDKHFKPSDAAMSLFQNRADKEVWLVLTESWCGDAAHSLPIMEKLAQLSGGIDFKVVLRDQNLELMDEFLTNGGRGIPKLIVMDAETHEVKGSWGPRPAAVQEMRLKMIDENESKEEISKALQLWYARDRGKTIEQELLSIFT